VAELTGGSKRVRLGTFSSSEDAARVYDATCWRFSRGRDYLNFSEV
jgi:hypothetical protein